MRAIVKNVFAAIVAMICFIHIGINSVGFHTILTFANNIDDGKQRDESIKLETKAKLDIAARFNIEMEDIDCEDIFSKPSFGKAYHKSGAVQDYCKAIKPGVLPEYQLWRTDYLNGSKHPTWSIGTIGILCFLLLVCVLIILGRILFYRKSSKQDFKLYNEI